MTITNNKKWPLRTTMLLASVFIAGATSAHHSAYVHFDRDDVVEMTAELVSINWRNPHTEMVLRTTNESGQTETWIGQERGATLLARKNVTQDMLQAGSTLRVAGFRGRRNQTAVFVTNIMLPDGREIFNESFAEQRWEAELAGTTMAAAQAEKIQDRPVTTDGIFRVWSTQITAFEESDRILDRALWNDKYPLTDYARQTQADWDPVEDNPFIFCQNGMPAIMDQIQPMEFVDKGDQILLRLEEQDVVRTIHMSGGPAEAPTDSPYGHSVGNWDGTTLVIRTTDIDWAWFDQDGLPQSDALELLERFTPSENGYTLDYRVTATDPTVFSEPVELGRNWIWVPDEVILPYECEWEGDTL
jgi:hypothetical protein